MRFLRKDKEIEMRAVIGIGNPLKKDDNIGNLTVEKLSKEIKNKDFIFIKAYLTPENYLMPLKKSKLKAIYFIDAVDFQGLIGEVKLFDLNEIQNLSTSTHNIPITIYKKYFPNTEIKLLGIKVKDTGFGEGLSKEIKDELDNILEKVKKIISQ